MLQILQDYSRACKQSYCNIPVCSNLKRFTRHGVLCKTRAAGGCHQCRDMWRVVQQFSQTCIESNSSEPLCTDLKKFHKRAQEQSDSERVAAKLAEIVNFQGTPKQLRETLDLVVHISRCSSASCSYVNCGTAKGLFTHSSLCKTRVVGGCLVCQKLWHIIHLHAAACKKSNCNVPRCRDVKERLLHLVSQQEAGVEMRKIHDLVVHIPQCQTPRCQYPNCGKFKRLIRHGALCKTRAAGGCHLCKDMWCIIQHFSEACTESNCSEPLCRDLKACQRRAQEQSDSERQAAKLTELVNFQGTPEQLKEILDLVVHISQCPSASCSYLNCGTAKGLFTHSSLCKTRVAGGCPVCRKLWRIIYLHAAACKKSNCNVPRCRDVKERLLHLVSQREAGVELVCGS